MTATDLRFAVNFYPDVEVSGSAVVPGGTNPPSSTTGISVTFNSAIITGPNGWTTGIVNGNRIQVAYQPAAGGAAPDGDLSGWLKAFDWYNSYATSITATQVTVTQSDLATQQLATYTYNNASPPVPTPTVPLTVRWWDSTVDPTPVANALVRYGGWPVYCKNGTDAEGTMIIQWQNFTSFNLRAIGDNNALGSGIVNLAISPGSALYFCDADIKDNIAGFGLGYLSRKKWGNYQAGASMSNVTSGTQAYVGAFLTYPPVPGGAQSTDIRNPYGTTTITTSNITQGVTASTQSVANNGQVVGINTVVNAIGNIIYMTGAPTISNASAGRTITIINVDTTATFRFIDEANSAGVIGSFIATNLSLQETTRDLAPNGSITLTFTQNNAGQTYWFESSFATTGGAAAILNKPLQFLSEGSSGNVDPFAPSGFLYLISTISLGTAATLSNFLRFAPNITFQAGAATGTHNPIALSGTWTSDPALGAAATATIGDIWGQVDSRQFISRGVLKTKATTGAIVDITGSWQNRTYWGDLGSSWDVADQDIGDVGARYDLTLKGQASLAYRRAIDFRDITMTSVTYAGAQTTVQNVQFAAGSNNAGGTPSSTTSPTTGRGQNGYPWIPSDVTKTITAPILGGVGSPRTITSLANPGTGADAGHWGIAIFDGAASASTVAQATVINDPNITYSPTAIPRQVAVRVQPLSQGVGGTDDTNRGIDNAAASYLGGNVYGGFTATEQPLSGAFWSISATTGAATFGKVGAGTGNQLSAITNTQTFLRLIRDGAAALGAGVSAAGIIMQGAQDAASTYQTIASFAVANDSNVAWANGATPGRLELRTNTGTGTRWYIGVDHNGKTWWGNPLSVSGNVISSTTSSVAIDPSVGSVLSSSTGGIGYSTGAGGTATQLTSKATAFPTISKTTGTLTWNAASLAADTTVTTASSTNTTIAATDVVVFTHISGGTLGAYIMTCTPGSGTWTLTLHNTTGGALAEAPVFAFAIIKGVTA